VAVSRWGKAIRHRGSRTSGDKLGLAAHAVEPFENR
jgi:hypothetical protein